MSLQLRPLSNAVGVEVLGIDLRETLDERTVAAVKQAWLDHLVLLFRDQQIDADDQRRFTRIFGDFQTALSDVQTMDNDVLFLANFDVPGHRVSKYVDGEMQFHQDGVYVERPSKATFLYAVEIPQTGGNTVFASTYRAYDALPADLRARAEQADVLFNYFTNMKRGVDPVLEIKRPEYVHPMVIAHPITGRPLLLCNRLMTDSVVGLSKAESDALIETVFAYIEDPAYVYEHVWRVGDLVMWDNLATAHARTHYEKSERRMLRRTTIVGDPIHAYRPRTPQPATA